MNYLNHVINYFFATYCKHCRAYRIDHTSETHKCSKCGAIGLHGYLEHRDCKFCCYEGHDSDEHVCVFCGELGHELPADMHDKCELCHKLSPEEIKEYKLNRIHNNYRHECTVCNNRGHQKTLYQHEFCKICEAEELNPLFADRPKMTKYTHLTKEHLKYIVGIGAIVSHYKRYKWCKKCQMNVNFSDEGKCLSCSDQLSETLKCNYCEFEYDNMLYSFCPMCGSQLRCRGCYKLLTESWNLTDSYYFIYCNSHE